MSRHLLNSMRMLRSLIAAVTIISVLLPASTFALVSGVENIRVPSRQLKPHPPSSPPPQILLQRREAMRGGGDMPLPSEFAASRQKKDIGNLAFMLLGVGTFVPWNVLLLTVDFLASICPHYGIGQISSSLALATIVFNVSTLSIMVRLGLQNKIGVKARIIGGFVTQCAVFLGAVIGSLFLKGSPVEDVSTHGERARFRLIVAASCLLGACDAVVQGGLVGYASKISSGYAQSLSTGQAWAGVGLTLMRMLSKLVAQFGAGGTRSAEEQFLLNRKSALLFFFGAGAAIGATTLLFLHVERFRQVADKLASNRLAEAMTAMPRSTGTRTMRTGSCADARQAALPLSRSLHTVSNGLKRRLSFGLRCHQAAALAATPPLGGEDRDVLPVLPDAAASDGSRNPARGHGATGTMAHNSSWQSRPRWPFAAQAANADSETRSATLKRAAAPASSKKPITQRLQGCSLALMTVFCVSVLVFPSVTATIQSSRADPNRWFPMQMCLVWGIGELAGRASAEGRRLSARAAWLPLSLRVLLLPVFIALSKSVAALGRAHDAAALVAIFVMSSTLGFFSSVMTAYASSKATVNEREEAGQFVQFSVATGLALGSALSVVLNRILERTA